MDSVNDIQRKLEAKGLILESRSRLPSGLGYQLRFKEGEIVNVFDKGSVSFQGKNQDRVRKILGVEQGARSAGLSLASRKVFVIYGHDTPAKAELEAILRRWHLEPLILDQLPSEGQTIIEKLEKYTGDDVKFAVALATPDDEGFPSGKPGEKRFRARQNVVLELGLLLGKLGRSRVAILIKTPEVTEHPSDIQGLIYIPFSDSVESAKVTLAKEMAKQGLPVEVSQL